MYIGIDIGGTKIRGGLLDSKFRVIKVVEQPTEPKRGRKVVLNNIYSTIKKLDDKKVKGIGLGSRGFVDYKSGVIKSSSLMFGTLKNLHLTEMVAKKFKKKAFIDNDVNCFTLAEGVLGAGKNYRVVVGVTLGTGIGGGLLIDKKLYRGGFGSAAEFGKMIIDIEWFKDSRGRWGTFEQLASGTAMDNLYKLKTGKRVGSKEVEFSMYRGNKKAEEVIKNMTHYLAAGLANIIVSVNPEVIIMGGGVGKVRALVDPAIKIVPQYVQFNSAIIPPIKYAELGPHAGLMGAALLNKEGK